MASIEYVVSDKAVIPSRDDTLQTLELRIVSKFDIPPVTRVGAYAASMDHKSGRGTLVAKYQTFTMEIVFDDDERPYVEEMLYSLMDYQTATLYGSDLPKLQTDREFVLQGDQWSFTSIGCDSNRLQFTGKFQG